LGKRHTVAVEDNKQSSLCRLNIQTSECHFYGLEESPSYDEWKLATGSANLNGLTQAGTNWTNRDYIFFTRDIFIDDSFDKGIDVIISLHYLLSRHSLLSIVDIASGRKLLTSWSLEEYQAKKSSKTKGKEPQKKSKSINKFAEGFPMPWIQLEFKEPMYITEILLQTTKGNREQSDASI